MNMHRQRGYTLIEIVIALFIALFLLAGLFTILQNTRRTSSNQNGLTLLQDQQRMAMSILNDVIQNAGYFDTNTYQSALTAWPAAVVVGIGGTTLAAGQAMSGVHSGTTTADTLVARYASSGSDGIISCSGASPTVATNLINVFYIASNQLMCSPDGTSANAVVLVPGVPNVSGVQNMQVWYGVSTTAGSNNVDTYFTADQLTASTWQNVTSVRITLTFVNPLYATGQSTLQTVPFTRVIALQGRTGVVATAL
jgi:type IV pilus assembly protein PilW